jgi:hypothetical protein
VTAPATFVQAEAFGFPNTESVTTLHHEPGQDEDAWRERQAGRGRGHISAGRVGNSSQNIAGDSP